MFRRFVSGVVLAVMLVGCFSAALAEKKEILFRSIPWNASFQDVYNSLYIDGKLPLSELSISEDETMKSWDYDIKKKTGSNDAVPDAGYSISLCNPTSSDATKPFDLAGYPIEFMYCYFIYKHKDAIIVKDRKDNIFYKAEYRLDVQDAESAYEDLTDKMSELYGKYKKGSKKTDVYIINDGTRHTQYEEWRIWSGAKDTTAYVRYFYNIEKGSTEKTSQILYVVYANTKNSSGIKSIIKSMAKAEKEKNRGNNNGL